MMEKHKIKWKPPAKLLDTEKFVSDLPFLSTGNTHTDPHFVSGFDIQHGFLGISSGTQNFYCKKYSTLSKSSVQKITLKLAIDDGQDNEMAAELMMSSVFRLVPRIFSFLFCLLGN